MPEEKERTLRGPVGWLLDRQLLINLREIFLYSAFGTRIDPRNWMTGREIDLSDDFVGDELWFDYLSDTGDSMVATYSMAYLAYSDIWTSPDKAPGPARLDRKDGLSRLPRGAFLVVGGDTAYHVADYETLADRFQYPFDLAFKHLDRHGKVDKKRRSLFGIPGNHDYYDFLDGFNRQFRRPYNADRRYKPNAGGDQPQLVIEGFRRRQSASYFSLKLPFGWRMWGMDAQGGSMDRRQKNFFRSIRKNPEKPTDRLIVATPEPITSFGRRAGPDSEIVRTFEDIGLPRPFLEGADPLPAGTCRLDIAGDVHHYARYWGAEPGAARPARYASVVSGLGGAFLHSSSTDIGEIPAARAYPPPGQALAETLKRLLKPWLIFLGGRVWHIGLLVAGLLYIAASSTSSIQSVLELEMRRIGLQLPTLPGEVSEGLFIKALRALRDSLSVPGVGAKLRFHRELYFLPLLLLLVGLSTFRNGRLAAKRRHGEAVPDSAYDWPVYLLVTAASAIVSWIYTRPYPLETKTLHPFTANFAVLGMLGVSFLGLWWCRQYDDAMNFKARLGFLTLMDQVRGWLLWIFTISSALFGVTRYGVYSLGVAAIDFAFLVVVLGILIGLPAFACGVGGQLHRLPGRIGFFGLGLLHAFLQLAVPVVLVVSVNPWLGWGAAAATVLFTWLVSLIVPFLARDAGKRYLVGVFLLGLWLACGLGLLVLALWQREPQTLGAASFLLALGLGAILSCTWFGWYLAVSLCFDGHNNEAGGGARIEQFKQLIRFRLTRESLTGYVIAIDEPRKDGSKLEPCVIDVFEVRPD